MNRSFFPIPRTPKKERRILRKKSLSECAEDGEDSPGGIPDWRSLGQHLPHQSLSVRGRLPERIGAHNYSLESPVSRRSTRHSFTAALFKLDAGLPGIGGDEGTPSIIR
ncbi:hypothetical protein JTE90_028802 [Oedothorax gibbosus]|uniref:Uncharacterized protein n=1 Tax=Oedothorax gibbosus TaxID=931172 RepID=A0AAV6VZ59_9ARAC|nr:hypothetical protein JTE90_028802 [Oedothorax gibbosus]